MMAPPWFAPDLARDGAWAVVAAATACIILRPRGWPEWIWAAAGAALLPALGLLPPAEAWAGVAEGADVYLFLTGMMLLSELARAEGLFDWLAAHAVRAARGSATRLFALVYGVGTLVTVFLSNDATAVVLTPAVLASVRAARVRDPLPFLFACAFVANAASFVLPISNPANLVIYGTRMPPLLAWLPRFALPSLASVAVTFAALLWSQRRALRAEVAEGAPPPDLSRTGRLAACGVAATAVVLLLSSGFGIDLGLPTFLAGLATALAVLPFARNGPGAPAWSRAWALVRGISWGVLPLVAGLFVFVRMLDRTGVTTALAAALRAAAAPHPANGATALSWGVGGALAFGSNLVNNLPAGLLAGRVAAAADVPDTVRSAVLIGVDLGPNLSVTGSLATILWLSALRREGMTVGAAAFLRIGALAMPLALAAALACASLS